MESLGLTKDYFPVFPGDHVWEPQHVRLRGVMMRKDTPTDEDPKAFTDTFIPGKLIWQPVEMIVGIILPSPCFHRYTDCHTYCESLNRSSYGHQSHAQMH
jgi:hypothetical protein